MSEYTAQGWSTIEDSLSDPGTLPCSDRGDYELISVQGRKKDWIIIIVCLKMPKSIKYSSVTIQWDN